VCTFMDAAGPHKNAALQKAALVRHTLYERMHPVCADARCSSTRLPSSMLSALMRMNLTSVLWLVCRGVRCRLPVPAAPPIIYCLQRYAARLAPRSQARAPRAHSIRLHDTVLRCPHAIRPR